MIDEVIANIRCVNRSLSRVTTDLLRGQWACLDAGLRTMDQLLSTAAEPPAPAGEATVPAAEGHGELGALEGYALDRARKGLPPPRELYDVKYRDRIDWLRFPAWARPSDPEVYTGCGHEG
jgi:hypothetical protein